MKKILLLTIFLLIISLCLKAQEKTFSFGVKSGMNLSNLNNDGPDMDARIGYQFGVVGEYELPKNFFLQSSLSIASKGAKLKIAGDIDFDGDGYVDRGSIKSTWNAVYLELPVLAGYRVDVTENLDVKFMTGPYIAYGVGGNISAELNAEMQQSDGSYKLTRVKDKTNTFSDETLKRFDMGLSGAVAVQYNKLLFTIGYDYGLTSISQGTNSIHNRSAYLTVGYMFF